MIQESWPVSRVHGHAILANDATERVRRSLRLRTVARCGSCFGLWHASSYTQTNATHGDNTLHQNRTFGPVDPSEETCEQYLHQLDFQHSIENYL